MNVVDPIVFQAKVSPAAMAICTPGMQPESITYGELVDLIDNIGRQALSANLKCGQLVAVHVRFKILHVAIMLALMRLGIATVSAWTTVLPKALSVDAVIADAPDQFQNVARVIVADSSWCTPRHGASEPISRTNEDDVCQI